MPSITPQAIDAGLTRAAIFLVAAIEPGEAAAGAVRALCGDLAGLLRSVGFRSMNGGLSCAFGIGAQAWGRLFGAPAPRELHPFREISGVHHAPATPGDLLLHIRAERMDLCFEAARLILARLDGAVAVVDETHGFGYFDQRDLLGFVDGTENPSGAEATAATRIGGEDPDFAGGSYVIVQKYLHDLKAWDALPVETQEKFVGRKKLSDVELSDGEKPSYAHNALTSITDENGEELAILRDNMPFGDIGRGEFGTYFIGYARAPSRIETMLENMFVGRPPGNYDRLLDYSRATTGGLFFVPAADLLERLAERAGAPPAETGAETKTTRARPEGSLAIGSLRTGDGK